MNRRSLFLRFAAGLASAMLVAVCAPAQAGTVIVDTDSGGGTVDVLGTATGAQMQNFNAQLTEINAAVLSPNLPLTFSNVNLTSTGTSITGGSGEKIIGSGANQADLFFTVTGGSIGTNFVNITALITGVTPPGQVTSGTTVYDFSHMAPGGLLDITLTSTSGSFLATFNNAGATDPHVGIGIDQSIAAVPEPASLALLGIGMTGFLAFRRLFKRASAA